MQQIIVDLVVNARDAMPHGGVLGIRVRRVAAAEQPPQDRSAESSAAARVRLSVADSGHGMSAAVKSKIFESFFTTKGPGRGTGLGLAVVHGIGRQAGGTISVHSEVGSGATFDIDLSVANELADPAAMRHAAPKSAGG